MNNEECFVFMLLSVMLILSSNNSLSNFERTVFTQTEAAIERCSGKSVFWNVLKTTPNDLKSMLNDFKIIENTCEGVHF